jgi:hypothetical protein
VPGCASEDAIEDEGGARDDQGGPGIELLPRNQFSDAGVVPVRVAFQFVSQRDLEDSWALGPPPDPSIQFQQITYSSVADIKDAHGFGNDRVAIQVPDQPAGRLLKFAFEVGVVRSTQGEAPDLRAWQAAQYVDLDADTTGEIVKLDLTQSAPGGDAAPTCFDGTGKSFAVMPLGGGASVGATIVDKDVDGRIDTVFYGFTTGTSQQYCGPGSSWETTCQRNELEWLDSAGGRAGAGHVPATYYRTANGHQLAPMYVRVPKSLDLVWRVKFADRFEAGCRASLGPGESRLFFRAAFR